MPEESVPVMVCGSEYHLRYGIPDVAAVENDCAIGYPFLFEMREVEKGYTFVRMSVTHLQHLIRRGLRIKNPQGELQYAYPQDSQVGLDRAGEFIQLYLKDGNGLGDLMLVTRTAFEVCGWPVGAFRKQAGEPQKN